MFFFAEGNPGSSLVGISETRRAGSQRHLSAIHLLPRCSVSTRMSPKAKGRV